MATNCLVTLLFGSILFPKDWSVASGLQIDKITFPDYAMLGQTVTMVCEFSVGQSEFIDSIKWYKDNLEFYRIVPNTPIERDRVVTFPRPGIKLEKEKSGVRAS